MSEHRHTPDAHGPHSHSQTRYAQHLDELDFERSLHGCASRGDLASVARLLSRRRDVNAKDSNGLTALHYAARTGSVDVIDALILAGASVNNTSSELDSTPLHKACAGGHVGATKLLLKYRADPLARDHDGRTPLHVVASGPNSVSRTELVDLLMTAAPEAFNARDKNGSAPSL
ncbi:hypothetical protein SeLEV6574_g07773 [Synchytrium endobioticum]|uniref:Uncharacterized protein n=1 Tax=Synchytrium endobioticum TaxID=286115 RepID=A0A507CG87_9FUNG|nr:hypothetical protein SeLEV6574_g07773 [Synchytrium endobioticum]